MFNKEKLLIIAILLFIGTFINCNVQHNDLSRKQLFDLNWKFTLGNPPFASVIDFNDKDWRSLDLPHDWSKDQKLFKSTSDNKTNPFTADTGWYRKQFEIPDLWLNKVILIDFEGIYDHCEIFVNGISVHDSGKENSSFQATLNPYLNFNGNNVIAVHMAIPKQADGTWKTDSGIYKHVWLVVKDSAEFKN